jgi:hypothetical protein
MHTMHVFTRSYMFIIILNSPFDSRRSLIADALRTLLLFICHPRFTKLNKAEDSHQRAGQQISYQTRSALGKK